MFACIFFEEDRSFAVIRKGDKKLKYEGEFEPKKRVEMDWYSASKKTTQTFEGTIVKVHENEESLTKFGRQAFAHMKGRKMYILTDDILEMDLNGQVSSECSDSLKRQRKQTAKLKESKEQDEETVQTSPSKKTKVKSKATEQHPEKSSTTQPKKKSAPKDKTSKKVKDTPSTKRKEKEKATENATGLNNLTLFSHFSEQFGNVQQNTVTLSPPVPTMTAPLSSVPAMDTRSSSVPVMATPLSSVPVMATPLSSVPVMATPLSSVPVMATPLSSVPVMATPLSSVPAMDTRSSSVPVMTTPSSSVPTPPGIVSMVTSPLSSVPQMAAPTTNTTLTDTWRLCQDAQDQHTAVHASKIPVPSEETLKTLRGLLRPEVQQFMAAVCDHFASTTCRHEGNECYQSRETGQWNANQHEYNDFAYNTDNRNDFADSLYFSPSFTRFEDNNMPLRTFPIARKQTRLGDNCMTAGNSPAVFRAVASSSVVAPTSANVGAPTYTSSLASSSASVGALSTERISASVAPPSFVTPAHRMSTAGVITHLPSAHTNVTQLVSPGGIQMSTESTGTDDMPVILRRSPRKHASQDSMMPSLIEQSPGTSVPPLEESGRSADTICLLPKYPNVIANRTIVRKAVVAANTAKNPGYTMMMKLLPAVFTEEEMARSKGQGITNKGGDIREALDSDKIAACKEYTIGWCRKQEKSLPTEKSLNIAVTEKIGYCRRKLKKDSIKQ